MWFWLGLAWAECPAVGANLEATATAALSSFAGLDAQGLAQRSTALRAELDCLAEPVSTQLAVQVHLALALDAFVNGSRADTRDHFSSLRHLEPGFVLPDTLVPNRHPLRVLFTEAKRPGGPGIGQAADVLVDGLRASVIPTDRPVILQTLGDDGAVTGSLLTRSVRSANAELDALEVASLPISPETGGGDVVPALSDLDRRVFDCPTQARVDYDRGVVASRLGDASTADAAFQAVADSAKRCAPEYANRAKAALDARPVARSKPKPTFKRVWVGAGVGLEIGAHNQVRRTDTEYDVNGEVLGQSAWEYSTFGVGPALVFDLRGVPLANLEVGGGLSISSVKITTASQAHLVDATESLADSVESEGNAFEANVYVNAVIAQPRWVVKPTFKLGGQLRSVPMSGVDVGELAVGELTVDPVEPLWDASLTGGLIFGPGLRWELGSLLAIEWENTLIYTPDAYSDDLDAGITTDWDAAGRLGFAVRPTVMLKTGF